MGKIPLYSFLYILQILTDFSYYHQALADKCNEDLFYLPYVKVKRKKNGGNLASLKSSGFIDLRFRNRIILCINGPTVLYSDVEKVGDPGESLRFKNGELRVFNHECISVNKVPTNVVKKMKEKQGRNKIELTPDTPVNGKLVLGIFLIGNKEGYKSPEIAWFKGPNYEYIKSKDKTVKDASFILTGSNATHCIRLSDGTNIQVTAVSNRNNSANNSLEVCRWTVREEDKPWYAKVFQRGFDGNGLRNGEPTLQETDYKFYDCPDGDMDRNIILTMGKTPEPVTHTNYTEFDPFSLFNPNLWTPHGYRKETSGLSGGDERPEDKGTSGSASLHDDIIPCSVEPKNPNCENMDDLEMTTLSDMQNVDANGINSVSSYEILAGECMPLPVFSEEECTGVGKNGERLMELVLELAPAFVPDSPVENDAEPTEAQMQEFHKYQNLNDNSTLRWKYDLLYKISDIFSHLCMPFKPEMPYTVARVFAWYVYKAHLFGEEMGRVGPPPAPTEEKVPPLSSQFDQVSEKNDPWPLLLKELERCSSMAKSEGGGKGLKYQWEVGDDSGMWKIPAVDGRETKRKKRSTAINRIPVQKAYLPPESKLKNEHSKPPEVETEEEELTHPEKLSTDAEEIILERHKRNARANYYKVNGSKISTKYLLPGKSLKSVRSEGTSGYAREVIQEYRKKKDVNDPRADIAKYLDYPENIQHCWNPQEDPITNEIVCSRAEDIFFYEDRAEIEYDLNIAIDLWWKIWATALGYCNKAYHSRKSETFPRLYSAGFEYFFELVQKEWRFAEDNEVLRILFSEYLTEESQIWLDVCLEASYIASSSQSFRPPRPMMITEHGKEMPNYFEEIPSYLYFRFHPDRSANL